MKGQDRITCVATYDYSMSILCDRAGIDIMLVGDSLGMVVLGYGSTAQVTMGQMRLFTEAVCRAREDALVTADMPFMSYQASAEDAVRNAGILVRAGADSVKLEGGRAEASTVRRITDSGIPVMGHIGLQPQTGVMQDGYKTRGMTAEAVGELVEDAKALEEAGAFCIVLEKVSAEAAERVTKSIRIPTIGIGSGPGCDGQVLVLHDMLGIYDRIRPKFAKRYLDLAGQVSGALERYRMEVRSGAFPSEEHLSRMGGKC